MNLVGLLTMMFDKLKGSRTSKEYITDELRKQSDQSLHRLGLDDKTVGTTPSPTGSGQTPKVRTTGSTYSRAADIILRVEGGFTIDSGGPTFRGVTLSTYNSHAGKLGLPKLTYSSRDQIEADMKKYVTKDVALKIYESYWVGSPAEAADKAGFPKTALAIFDISINGGPGRANSITAAVLGDKGGGTKTWLPIFQRTNLTDEVLAKKIAAQMHSFRMGLTSSNPAKYGRYKNGWTNRYNHILKVIDKF